MDLKIGVAVIGLGAMALSPAAFAQTSPSREARPSTIQGRSDSLSGKLDASGGVIKPANDIDPGIQTRAPVAQPNSTPVIPPSATGGQNAK